MYCKYNLNFSLGKAEVLEQPLQSISKSIGERLIDKPFHRSEREDTSNKERKEEREETRADTIQPLFGKDDFNNRPSYKEKYMSREETKGRIFESSEEESSEFVGRLDQNKVKNKVDSQFLSDVSTHKIGFLKVILYLRWFRLNGKIGIDTCMLKTSQADPINHLLLL